MISLRYAMPSTAGRVPFNEFQVYLLKPEHQLTLMISAINGIACNLNIATTVREIMKEDQMPDGKYELYMSYDDHLGNRYYTSLRGIEGVQYTIGKTEFDAKIEHSIKRRTISSVVGACWSQHTNAFGTVSGQDKVHTKTGLLTFGELFEFYTTKQGSVDFGHFTTLKDVATNCSMSMGRGVTNFHTKANPRPARSARTPDAERIAALEKQVAHQGQQIAELRRMIQALMRG